MPREGRKTIDLPDKIVNDYMSKFKENEEELKVIGITSFTGFMSRILHTLLVKGVLPKDLERFFETEIE